VVADCVGRGDLVTPDDVSAVFIENSLAGSQQGWHLIAGLGSNRLGVHLPRHLTAAAHHSGAGAEMTMKLHQLFVCGETVRHVGSPRVVTI
jgi:hypothetical protein